MVTSTPPPFPILLLDGGLGTTLETNHTQTFNDSTPLWSSDLLLDESSRSILLCAQRSFVDAGIDILLSPTYQASLEGFSKTRRRRRKQNGKDEDVTESKAAAQLESNYYTDQEESSHLMRSAIPLARTAITTTSSRTPTSKKRKLALSLGPYGATMTPSTEYSGQYDASHRTTPQLLSWHKNRLDIYQVDAETWYDIDYVAFETVPKIEEIEAVRRAMYTSMNGWDRKFWISCVFPGVEMEEGRARGFKLPDGSGVKAVVEAMLAGGEGRALPWGIGINCTKIGKLPALVEEFEDAVEALIRGAKVDGWPFLVLYPDGAEGLVYDTEKHVWEADEKAGPETTVPWDERMIAIVKDVRDGGRWRGLCVGGCCKVLPADVANLRRRIDEL